MELTNDFLVDVEPAKAWEILTDVEKVAPCLPGAQLREIEGDEYERVEVTAVSDSAPRPKPRTAHR